MVAPGLTETTERAPPVQVSEEEEGQVVELTVQL